MTEQEEMDYLDANDIKIISITKSFQFYLDKCKTAKENKDAKTFIEARNRLKKEIKHCVEFCDSMISHLEKHRPDSTALPLAKNMRVHFQDTLDNHV